MLRDFQKYVSHEAVVCQRKKAQDSQQTPATRSKCLTTSNMTVWGNSTREKMMLVIIATPTAPWQNDIYDHALGFSNSSIVAFA